MCDAGSIVSSSIGITGGATGTIAPEAAAQATTDTTVAVVACHLHGVPADVPALRERLPGVRIIEDCAQAWAQVSTADPSGRWVT